MRPLSELDSAYLAAHAQSRDLRRPVVGLPPVEMRVLTVRQPWAWAIIHGQKSVENRSRNIAGSYRGPVAIHAGLGLSAEGWADRKVQDAMTAAGGIPDWHVTGRVIGVVDLVGAHAPDACTRGWCSPWAMENHHHLVLANPRPLATPIPAKGRLGLWRPDAALSAAITAALAPVQTITDQEGPR